MSLEILVVTLGVLGVAGLALLFWRGRAETAPVAAPVSADAEVTATALQLEREANAVLDLMRAYEEAGERYCGSLALAEARLTTTLVGPEQIATIVRLLLADNAKMQLETGELKKNLEQSKSQIDKLRSHLADAHEVSMRDHLTALRNRRCFDDSLATELANARTRGTALSLVMADIDDFKRVNDQFGHQVGDEILKTFARIITDNARAGDTIARYGGEEFAIILPATRVEEASALTERIRSRLQAQQLATDLNGKPITNITASFGIAELDADDDAAALVQRADMKLYRAKCEGKNRVAADQAVAA